MKKIFIIFIFIVFSFLNLGFLLAEGQANRSSKYYELWYGDAIDPKVSKAFYDLWQEGKQNFNHIK